MRHIITFEDIVIQKMSKNDIVTCIDSTDSNFFNKVGVVMYASTIGHKPFCDVLFVGETNPVFIYNKDMMLATPEEIEQYKLEKDANKYNL